MPIAKKREEALPLTSARTIQHLNNLEKIQLVCMSKLFSTYHRGNKKKL